jgi:adenosine deaminase
VTAGPSVTPCPSEERLRQLPKVELHVHLEGSFTPERVSRLAEQAGEQFVASRMHFTDLADFLESLDWWCSLVKTPKQAEEQAELFARYLAQEGIVYAEVTVNPTHWSSLERTELIDAVGLGFQKAHTDYGIDARTIVSLKRGQAPEDAMTLVEYLIKQRPLRVVGLGVDGNEAALSSMHGGSFTDPLAEVFAAAGFAGLGLTAHAGESSGPDGVWRALDALGVSRIDHGIRSIEDDALLARLAAEGVTLNVCPTSNACLLYGGSLERHPLPRLVAAGVPVTVNTDDPMVFGTNLSRELCLAASLCAWDRQAISETQSRACRAAFCSRKEREMLEQKMRTAYQEATEL